MPRLSSSVYSHNHYTNLFYKAIKLDNLGWPQVTDIICVTVRLLSRHRLSAFVICSIRRTWDKWLMELDWKKRSNNTQNPKAQCPIHCELNLICFWTVTVLLRVTFSHPTWCHRQWQLGLCGRNRTELNTDTNTRHYYNLGSKTLSKA